MTTGTKLRSFVEQLLNAVPQGLSGYFVANHVMRPEECYSEYKEMNGHHFPFHVASNSFVNHSGEAMSSSTQLLHSVYHGLGKNYRGVKIHIRV